MIFDGQQIKEHLKRRHNFVLSIFVFYLSMNKKQGFKI